MYFEENLIYHVYNQGNNKEAIFFERENYLFFLRKMRKHLLPYADILCYCLMPNHFHWLLIPKAIGIAEGTLPKPSKKTDNYKISTTSEVSAIGFSGKQKRLNQEIALLLSSYTKAINKRYGRKGSLFKSKTKAKNGWIDDFITIDGSNKDLFFRPENDYAFQCFQYIHANPVKAKMVVKAVDWEFSSVRDYEGMRNGSICNYKLANTIFNKGI